MTAGGRVPFKFLDPYTRADRDLFFGRDRELEEVHSRLLASGLLLVYGVSGCGKTSLVQCGLASKFEPADCLAITVRRGADILASLGSALEREAVTATPAGAPLDQRLRSLYLDHFKPIHLIFDQFEEVFIFGDREERRALAEALRDLRTLGRDLRLIFVVREEYLGAMTEFEPVLPRLFESRIRIERMDRFRAQAAIEGPCARCGVAIEPGLAVAVLKRLAPVEATVELTWLQVVMDRLYRQAAAESPAAPALTAAGLAALGPLDDVLGRFLDRQLMALPDPSAGKALLKAMVSGDGTRRPMTPAAIADSPTVRARMLTGDALQSLIQGLIAARILTDRDAHDCYELRHDSLARKVWEQTRQAEAQRALAGQQKVIALKSISQLTYEAVDPLLNLAGTSRITGRLIESNVTLLERLRQLDPHDPDTTGHYVANLQRAFDAWMVLGDTRRAAEMGRRLLDITSARAAADPGNSGWQRDLSVGYERLGNLAQAEGDRATAREQYQRALGISERLAAADPGNSEWQRDLLVTYNRFGDLAQAEGDRSAAREQYQRALSIIERLVATDPGNSGWQRDLSVNYERLGDLAQAEGDRTAAREQYQRSLSIRERLAAADPGNSLWQRDLAWTYDQLGNLAQAEGDRTAAREQYQRAFDIRERLASADPADTKPLRDLAADQEYRGKRLRLAGDPVMASDAHGRALAIRERLAAADPSDTERQRDLAAFHGRLGDLEKEHGDAAAATDACGRALAIRERLAAAAPDDAERQQDLALSHDQLGALASTQGDPAKARGHYAQAFAIRERLAAADPKRQRELADGQEQLGNEARVRGDAAAAADAYGRALAIRERLAAAAPDDAERQQALALSHDRFGKFAWAQDDAAKARGHYEAALAIRARLAAADPKDAARQRDLAAGHESLAHFAWVQGDPAAARGHLGQALAVRERLAAADPDCYDCQHEWSLGHRRLGVLALRQGDVTAALAAAGQAAGIAERLAARDPADRRWVDGWMKALLFRARAEDLAGDLERTVADFRQAIELDPDSAEAQGGLAWALIRLGRSGEARAPAEAAARLAPWDFEWPLRLGHIHLLAGDTATAQGHYDAAVIQVPDAAAFEKGPAADFEWFIAKGWQVEASRAALARMREAFARRGEGEDGGAEPPPPAAPVPAGADER